jgi:hypothetical protein
MAEWAILCTSRGQTLVMTVSSIMPPFSFVKTLREPEPLGMPCTSPTTSFSRKGTASFPFTTQVFVRTGAIGL